MRDAGRALPFRDQIQESFGHHDILNVDSHEGSAATEAGRALGASAFAMGNSVAFASPPDLHTAAHEAAHVVQQRGNVQLAGGIDEPGDPYERQADEVADAVVEGRSAEPLLDQIAPSTQTRSRDQVQRDSKASPRAPSSEQDALPPGVPYAIAPNGWSATVRASWVLASPVERIVNILTRMQHLGAFTWASPEGLRRAAQQTTVPSDRTTFDLSITLRTLAVMGLPPMSSAMVAREGDNLVIALRAGSIEDNPDRSLSLGPEDIAAANRAITKFTGLPQRQRAQLDAISIRAGIILVTVPDSELAKAFGRKEWDDWKRRRGSSGSNERDKPTSVADDLTLDERLRLDKWLRELMPLAPVGSESSRMDRGTLALIDELEMDPTLIPIVKREATTRQGTRTDKVDQFNLRDLIERAKYERERGRLGLTDKPPEANESAFEGFNVPVRITQKGLLIAGRAAKLHVEYDWDQLPRIGKPGQQVADFDNRHWHADVEWAIERTDGASQKPELRHTTHSTSDIDIEHTFQLGKDEKRGLFKVHAFLRTSHYAPKHVEAPLEVMTEDARMSELRGEAMGDMLSDNALWMRHHFDTGWRDEVARASRPTANTGKDLDNTGFVISGPLPRDFKVRDPHQRAGDRKKDLELHRKMLEYLRREATSGKPGYEEAIQAAEARLKRMETADREVIDDEGTGWRSFEIKGTYLSRAGDVPSGPLNLYGTAFYRPPNASSSPTTVGKMGAATPGGWHVKIRDLSNKVESDLEFNGSDSEHFDEALKDAFLDLCKTYPEGKMTILAEDQEIVPPRNSKPNGRAIGFELPTTSPWKRMKSKVFDPAIQVITNAAAMAVMIVFPPSAAVIVPALAATNIINTVDDMYTRHSKGKDSFATVSVDLMQIGLDLLPFARNARFLNPSKAIGPQFKSGINWRLFAFDMLSNAGEVFVMAEQVRDQLAEIQDKQIGAMAERYRQLLELQNQLPNPSDPRLANARAQIDMDAKAIRDTVYTTWMRAVGERAAFRVGAHLLPAHESHDNSRARSPVSARATRSPPRQHDPTEANNGGRRRAANDGSVSTRSPRGSKETHEALRAAEHVPDSGFRGQAARHETRLNLDIATVHTHVREAVSILNSSTGRRALTLHPDSSVTITVGGQHVTVTFVLGAPTESVATHDFKQGASAGAVNDFETGGTRN